MVNNCGHWTYEPCTPDSKKCWLDCIADWITSTGYMVETTIENVAIMVTSHWEIEMEDRQEQEDTIENCIQFVEESGGIGEFDYWC